MEPNKFYGFCVCAEGFIYDSSENTCIEYKDIDTQEFKSTNV